MKKTLQSFLLFASMFAGLQASAQVINVSTGISNVNGLLLPVGSLDDTWTVDLPGAPATFQTATCAANYYGGSSPNVRWIYPTGYSTNSVPMGDLYYKMTFNLDCADVTSAQFNFAHIGADDVIQDIQVNTTNHPVNYGFANWGVNTTLPLGPGELVAGTNTILVHVYNWGPFVGSSSPHGLEIEGNLTIVTAAPTASFTLTNNGTTVNATSGVSGTHTWIVYSSPTGNQGSYSYVNTYNTANLNFQATDHCYLIRHTVTNECGTACTSQSICNFPCRDCEIPAPTNLQLTYSGMVWPPAPFGPYKFSWNPVPGAASYVIEITWNDPTCCRNGEPASMQSIPVTNNSHEMEIPFRCFSWRVIALCEDGSPVASDKKCENLSADGGGDPAGKSAPVSIKENDTEFKISPNPASSSVSFDISSAKEVTFYVQVTDINGRSVKAFESKTEGKKATISWNTTSLAKGVYLVKITTSDNQSTTKKLVIE